MEKLLRPYDKEYMKLAMLKHEETFREQVCELHRLYRIQKALMKNSKSSSSSSIHGEGLNQEKLNYINSHNSNPLPSSKMSINFERLAGVYNNAELEGLVGANSEILDESEIELTLGPTSYKNRSKKADAALTSDSSPSFSSSSSRSSSHNGAHSGTHQLSPVQMPYTSKASENGGTGETGGGVEEGLIRERVLKQAPWFLQVLSLNSS